MSLPASISPKKTHGTASIRCQWISYLTTRSGS
jgi:hypothetical protein